MIVEGGRTGDKAGMVRRVVRIADLRFPAPYELEGDFDGCTMNFGPEELRKASAEDIENARAAGLLYEMVTTVVEVPEYWGSSSGITLVPDLSKLDLIQDMMTTTWRSKYTRDRKGSRVPSGARVSSVLRVENHEAFRRYCNYTVALRDRRGTCPRIDHGSSITAGTIGKYEQNLPALQQEIQETYLFHGTNPVAADSIARTDFDMSRAGSAVGTMFGPGVYLAENASKSDEYAHEGEGIFMGQRAMLLCRVCLGNVLCVEEPGDYSGYVESGNYDSVLGDRTRVSGTYREFIVFDSAAVYAEFIILYQRLYDSND